MEEKTISLEKHYSIIESIKKKAFQEIVNVKLNPDYKSSFERKWVAPTHEKISKLMCDACKGRAKLILYQLVEGIRRERKELIEEVQLKKHRNKLKNEVLSKLLFYHCGIIYKEKNLETDFEKIKMIIKQKTPNQINSASQSFEESLIGVSQNAKNP